MCLGCELVWGRPVNSHNLYRNYLCADNLFPVEITRQFLMPINIMPSHLPIEYEGCGSEEKA